MLLLATLGSLSLTGCLIAEAPEYGAPRRTTPVIESLDPSPLFQLIVRPEDPEVPFNLTVRSEDAGESVLAVPVLNYHVPDREEVRMPSEAPARAADQPKRLRVDIDLDNLLPMGCHTVTLLVMHRSSFDVTSGLPISAVSHDDVASVTWWVYAETAPVDGMEMPCPIAEAK